MVLKLCMEHYVVIFINMNLSEHFYVFKWNTLTGLLTIVAKQTL